MNSSLLKRMNVILFLVVALVSSIFQDKAFALNQTFVGQNNIFVGEYFTTYSTRFEAVIEATPSHAATLGQVGLGGVKPTSHGQIAAIVRFATNGKIQVIDGSNYVQGNNISYQANVLHRFRVIVDPAIKKYRVYVKVGTGNEQLVISSASFNSTQSSLLYFKYFSVWGTNGTSVSAKMLSIQPSNENITQPPASCNPGYYLVNGVCVKKPLSYEGMQITSSGDDGNVAANTRDNNFSTHWSSLGIGQWIRYQFNEQYFVSSTQIAFLLGTTRIHSFIIQVSNDGTNWTNVYTGQSSGTTLSYQNFPFNEVLTRNVRILGQGNNTTQWNNYTEVKFNDPQGGGSTGGSSGGSSTGGSSGGSSTGGSSGGSTTGGGSGMVQVSLFPSQSLIIPSNVNVGDVVSNVSSNYKIFHSASPVYSIVSNTSNNNFAISSAGLLTVSSISSLVAGQTYSITVKAQDTVKQLYDQKVLNIQVISSSNIVFIDPTDSGSLKNGTRAEPYTTWAQASSALTTPGKYILQKRGTVASISSKLNIGANNITIGTYDKDNNNDGNNTDDLPRLEFTSSGIAVEISARNNFTLRDFHVKSTSATSTSVIHCLNSHFSSIINSKIEGGEVSARINSCQNLNYLNSEFFNTRVDGIYTRTDGVILDELVFAYNYIHHVNLSYDPSMTDDDQAPGDGIQFNGNILDLNFHHNIIDRSDSGYKFCLIYVPLNIPAINQAELKMNYNFCKAPNSQDPISGFYIEEFPAGINTNLLEIIGNKFQDVNYGIHLRDWNNLRAHSNQFVNTVTGMKLGLEVGGEVYNNLFKNISSAALNVSENSVAKIKSRNNIFDLAAGKYPYSGTISRISTTETNNNLYSHQNITSTMTLQSWQNSGRDGEGLVGAPVYFNATAFDFHQRPTSPAVGLGADLETLDRDIEYQLYGTSPVAGPYQVVK